MAEPGNQSKNEGISQPGNERLNLIQRIKEMNGLDYSQSDSDGA